MKLITLAAAVVTELRVHRVVQYSLFNTAICKFRIHKKVNLPYASKKIENSSFERVEYFKYLGTTLTHQNPTHEEIKSRLKSGNTCYRSVQNLLLSRLLSKNLKIKIYRTITLSVVLYGCETWLITWREECRLREFQSGVLRRIFGPKKDEVIRE